MSEGEFDETSDDATGPRHLGSARSAGPRDIAAKAARAILKLPLAAASRLSRRDRHAWLFGNFVGFRDNPRYLVEHIVAHEPWIKPYWLAHSKGEAEAARAAGAEVVMRGTRAGRRAQQRAGVAFFRSGFRDLDMGFVSGTYLVWLYHGTPMKRLMLDRDAARFAKSSHIPRLMIGLVRMAKTYQHRQVDMYVASGRLARERYISAYRARPERVQPLGVPRFDVIRDEIAAQRVCGDDLRGRLGYQPDDRVVLWLPTWREYGDAAWLPTLAAEQVERALAGTNVQLLVKTHPFADRAIYAQRLPDHPQVRLLPEEQIDVNCLLRIADALITDYSSVAFDYAILGRPIYFLAPDIDLYTAGRDLYEPYDRLTGGMHHRDWASLLEAVAHDGGSPTEGLLLTQRVAEYAGNNTEPDVCHRLVDMISREIGLPSR